MKRHTAMAAVLIAGLLAAGCTKTATPKVASAEGVSQPRPSSTASPMPSPAADEGDRALQFQRCMQDHGVDVQTDTEGKVGVQATPGDKTKALSAAEACQIYLPGGGEKLKLSPEDVEKLRQFSQCVREHGFPDWPDPDPETGQMRFDEQDQSRLADMKNDPQFRTAIESCESLAPDVKAGKK